MSTDTRPFGQWHLRGGRYEKGGLPVEMLSEFARYERLVVDVAKGIYKQRHARRQRVPRGFASGFELRLTDVRSGSVIPVLEIPEESILGLAGVDVEGIFDEARILIQETLRVVGEGNDIPQSFPPQALREFSRFGRTLRNDERIEFDEGLSTAATYSQDLRRSLQERAQLERFEVETLVSGQVVGLLADKASFEFRLADGGRTVPGRFSSDEVVPDLKQYLDLSTMAPTVALNAVAIQSIDNDTIEIQDVLSVEPVLPAGWSDRLRALSELEEGWMDGEGERITRLILRQTETLLLDCLDAGIARPRIYPTVKGGVQLEWASPKGEVSVEILKDYKVDMFAFSKADDDNDREDSATWVQIDDIVDFIRGGIRDHITAVA